VWVLGVSLGLGGFLVLGGLGFYCIMGFYCILGVLLDYGGSIVSWVFVGGVSIVFWVLDGVCWGLLLYFGSLVGFGLWELWVCSFLWVFLGFLCGLAELYLCYCVYFMCT